MTKQEKVIKGLQGVFRCVSPVNHTCGDCPYQDNRVGCIRRVVNDAIALLKAQEPIEARLHLCESCKKQYPDCEATKEGVVFGNGIGNDNIIGCSAYDNGWMSQNEPRVLALDEIHSGMTVWLEDEDKTEVILAIVVVPDGICRCFITADNRRISPNNNDYRVRWRAWTSEPTDEMRKAVKWE